MAVTPISGQLEYVYGKGREGSAIGGLDLYELVHFNWDSWISIVIVLTTLLGLVGNSTVLWLLGFRIQRNPFSVYILNLAAADALFLCGAFLISLEQLLCFWSFHTYVVFFFLTEIVYTVGLSLLTAISIERCLSVLFPIWYRCHRPKHKSSVVCTVLWALGLLLWLFPVFLEYVMENPYFAIYIGLVTLVVWFTLLACVLCMSSLTLLLRVQCSSQCWKPPRLYLLVLLTVLMFLLCGLAPLIRVILELLIKYLIPFWISLLLACVNSSANPLIYFFLGSQRRKRREPLGVLLQRALADDEEVRRES